MGAMHQMSMSVTAAGGGGGSFDVGVTAKGVPSGSNDTATTNSVTTQATGSTFVIDVCWDNSASITTISDSKGNTYTIQGSVQSNSAITAKGARYICVNGTGGASHTATVLCSNTGAFPSIFFTEIKGGVTSGIVDVHVQGQDESSPFGIATGALAQANEYVLSFFVSFTSSPPTCNHAVTGDGFALLQQTTDFNAAWVGATGGVKVASTASVTPQWTETNTSAGTIVITTSFKGP